jgi:hypothetical protein
VATRIYLPSTGSADISPAYDAGWEDTTIASRLTAVTSTIASAMATVTFDDANTANRDILFRQYVLEWPLAAQTIIAQTVKCQIRGSTPSPANNLMSMRYLVKVVSSDGSTVRGVLVGSAGTPRTFDALPTNLTNRSDSTTSTSLAVLDGDRLVIEIGTGGDPGLSGAHDSSLGFGDSAVSDLPEDITTTTALNPWVEFADDLTELTQTNVTITSVTATATAVANEPVPAISPDSTTATATAQAEESALDLLGGVNLIESVTATATAEANVPPGVGDPNATITSVTATAAAEAHAPAPVLTVTSVTAAATAVANTPVTQNPGPGEDFIIPGPPPEVIYEGTEKAVYAQFIDANGDFHDPTTVSFRTRAPDGTRSTYVFGTDPEVFIAALGVYYVVFTVDSAGQWKVSAKGEDGDAVGQVEFDVKRSIF